MAASKIEWTEMTWNPSTGCTKISAGCANCYAEIMTRRLQAMGMKKYEDGFNFACHVSELAIPYNWKKPRKVFVNSMSDLFHEDMPLEFLKKVFKVMNECPNHIFQVLTKRADRLYFLSRELDWSPNIWVGVTVEDNSLKERIDYLREVPSSIRFLSLEPLLTPLQNLDLTNIDWVIVGGESGANSRPIEKEWVVDIKNQCSEQNIPFFFKQWGGWNKKANGNLLEGRIYNEVPVEL